MTLSKEQIEEWREMLIDPSPWASEVERVRAINALCDMALRSLSPAVPTALELDLAMTVRRLCAKLGEHPTAKSAMDFLARHGLQGSPLRNDSPAVPEGCVVPREPTEEMVWAAIREQWKYLSKDSSQREWIERTYKAMLSAAPPAAAGGFNITAVHLHGGGPQKTYTVEVEVNGRWIPVIKDKGGGPVSHIVESGGISAAMANAPLPSPPGEKG